TSQSIPIIIDTSNRRRNMTTPIVNDHILQVSEADWDTIDQAQVINDVR
ncbi:unnamed protein product, partial [Rotaria sp. Silwood1]